MKILLYQDTLKNTNFEKKNKFLTIKVVFMQGYPAVMVLKPETHEG